jgi:hypothetical protein
LRSCERPSVLFQALDAEQLSHDRVGTLRCTVRVSSLTPR